MSRGEKRRGREGWEKGDKEEKWKEKLEEGGGVERRVEKEE